MEEKMKDDEIEIDLGKFFRILCDSKKILGGIIVACTIIAMVYSLTLPPVFESNTLVQTNKSGKIDLSGSSAILGMLGGGSAGGGYPIILR